MDHMKKASVRDLRYHFPKIERMLAQGQEIQITKRRRVVGKLVPAVQVAEKPDFLARVRQISGGKLLKVSWAEFLTKDRDRF